MTKNCPVCIAKEMRVELKEAVARCEMELMGGGNGEAVAEDLECEGLSFAYAYFYCRYGGEQPVDEELYDNENGNLVE
jgi:hypothetical protein